MGRHLAAGIYVAALGGIVVGVDILFFRHHVWARLLANVGIVLVFAAFYLRFQNAFGADPVRREPKSLRRRGPSCPTAGTLAEFEHTRRAVLRWSRDGDGRRSGASFGAPCDAPIAKSGCAHISRHCRTLRSLASDMCTGEAHPATLLFVRFSCARSQAHRVHGEHRRISCRFLTHSFVVVCDSTRRKDDPMDQWTSIKNGREALGHYLAGIAADDWNKPSLCAGWTVKDTAAHMLVVPTMSRGQVFRSFLGSGFNLDKMNAKLVKKITAAMSAADIAAKTVASAGSQSMPPGLKLPGVLTELVVHSSDISEGVGNPFALPVEDYLAALDHLKDTQSVFGSKMRIAGLTMRTTDAEWSTGSGPTVEGPAQQLLLAVAGRRSAFDRLSGEGLATFRAR